MAWQYWKTPKGERVLMRNDVARAAGYTLHEDQSQPKMSEETKTRLKHEREQRLIRRGY